ncbi:MAG TPA: hypothetical protein VMZ53_31075 [Kofleriaceae bacterium]|nr:hypothetical protein [Kofleriaceae bacterium]
MRALVLLSLLIAGVAHADSVAPWEQGIPDAQQAKANALFAEANSLFAEKAHPAALEKYKAAVAVWDHPMIRFNMAVTLIRLDRMLEAADELEKALRFGAAPFTPELYEQAVDYQALVMKQLGTIEVRCDQPGTHVLLDGKPFFDAPGTKQVRTTSGEHSIVGEKRGFMTVARRIVVPGGKTAKETLQLLPVESAIVVEYKQPRWMPWVATATSAAIVGSGVAFVVAGNHEMDRFTDAFIRVCPSGCEADLSMHRDLADQQDSAMLKTKIGVSLLVGGGVAMVGSIVWGVTNRRTRRIGPRVEVSPTASGASASASWTF